MSKRSHIPARINVKPTPISLSSPLNCPQIRVSARAPLLPHQEVGMKKVWKSRGSDVLRVVVETAFQRVFVVHCVVCKRT